MTPSLLLTIILAIVVLGYLFDQILDYINLTALRKDIPEEVMGFYDQEKYQKSLDYQREQTRFSFYSSGFSFLLSLIMLSLGGFGWVDGLLQPFISNEILLALAFFGVIMIASDMINLPFQWYATFVIEEKFGFNKTTIKTFISDKIKAML